MADTKISELPVATVIASPDVAPVVRNGVTMQADVSLFLGSVPSIDSTTNVLVGDGSGNAVDSILPATGINEGIAIGIGASSGTGRFGIAIGDGAVAADTAIAIGYNAICPDLDTIVLGHDTTNDAYFGGADPDSSSCTVHAPNYIAHSEVNGFTGLGNGIVFPDSDPHIVGAGYWLAGVLTRSAG